LHGWSGSRGEEGVVPESAVREGGKQKRHKNTIRHMTLAEGIVAHGGGYPAGSSTCIFSIGGETDRHFYTAAFPVVTFLSPPSTDFSPAVCFVIGR
jgi:hypothetical protein